MSVYNADWYAAVVAPDSVVYDDGANYFRYQNKADEAASIYGYPGLSGDISEVRKALGKPLFIRHRVDADRRPCGTNHRTRALRCDLPWVAGSPHLVEAKRATRLGIVAVDRGSDVGALRDFKQHYFVSMQRKHAGKKYFDIADHLELWAGNAQVLIVEAPGAAGLFLVDDEWSHYHLSYREPTAHNTAMHAVFDLAVPRLAALGCKYLHLGGGTTPDGKDSLYQFKARIAPIEWVVQFEVIP